MKAVILGVIAAGGIGIVAVAQQQPSTKQQPAQGPVVTNPVITVPEAAARRQAAANRMVVYKSPTCGCCGNWITYVRNQGFQVEVHDVDDVTPIKQQAGVPEAGWSCHTAQIGGYFVEGHVPVEDIRRMLAERPDIRGIAAAGMPVGSPGMEMGERRDRYEVKGVRRDGTVFVFARH